MKLLITMGTALAFSLSLSAQVSEQSMELSLGHQNAFVMEHQGADKKMVTKILENSIKEYGKVKKNKKAKEWNCLECDVPGMSHPCNVYFKIEEGKDMITSYVFIDDGTQFISSDNNTAQAERIKQDLTYVGYEVTKAVITKDLESQEDVLKDRNKEQQKLEKKNKDLHNDIEKYKKKIEEAEKNIEKNLQEQEDKKMEIEAQKRTVGEVTEKLNNVGKN